MHHYRLHLRENSLCNTRALQQFEFLCDPSQTHFHSFGFKCKHNAVFQSGQGECASSCFLWFSREPIHLLLSSFQNIMVFTLLLIPNKVGKEDTSFYRSAVNNSPESFVDVDVETFEIQTSISYGRSHSGADWTLWRATLWWKQNCSQQKGSWHRACPCLLQEVEGRIASSVWGILGGSVCQGVVDQEWENMDRMPQDCEAC